MSIRSLSEAEIRRLLAGLTDGEAVRVRSVVFEPLKEVTVPGDRRDRALLDQVAVELSVELGQTTATVQEVLAYQEGSVIELDRLAGEAVDLLVNGQLVARGEVVVINDLFGMRVTGLVGSGAEGGASSSGQ